MITDQDVVQLFSNFSDIPLGLTEAEINTKNKQLHTTGSSGPDVEISFPVGCAHHLFLFSRVNVIPRYCFDCYKVAISPRNVIELFKLLMIFGSDKYGLIIENKRKCMVEGRIYCSGAYKGFIFCRGVEDGKAILELTQKVIAEHISPEVNIQFKRGCSEYAIKYPKFEQALPGKKRGQHVMPYQKSWHTREAIYNANYSVTKQIDEPSALEQTSYSSADGSIEYLGSEVAAMQYWLRYAATIGDESYLDIAGKILPPLPYLKPRRAY
jgi:hypothetical protein